MPLIHSPAKKPFQHNIKSELDAGKPMKQSLAIAYAVKRRAQEKKKMAAGGMVDDEDMSRSMDKSVMSQGSSHNEDLDPMSEPMGQTKTSSLPDESLGEDRMDAFFAHGGMANPKALAMKIMAKRKMADGGPVLDPDKHQKMMQGLDKAFGNQPEPKASPSPQSTSSDYDLSPEEKAKMKAKRDALSYADGGMVESMGQDDDFLSPEEQTPYPEDREAKRKRMISNIMRDLHSKARGMA